MGCSDAWTPISDRIPLTPPKPTFTPKTKITRRWEVKKDGREIKDFFVLNPVRDLLARKALLTYADLVEEVNSELAGDLRAWIAELDAGKA